jgi:hypothetical protein
MFLEFWLLRYRAKGRNEQNVEGEGTLDNNINSRNIYLGITKLKNYSSIFITRKT